MDTRNFSGWPFTAPWGPVNDLPSIRRSYDSCASPKNPGSTVRACTITRAKVPYQIALPPPPFHSRPRTSQVFGGPFNRLASYLR
jgi:hypothetical protein